MTKLLLVAAIAFVGVLSLLGLKLKGGPDVIWQTQKLNVTLAQGGRTSADASVIVNTDLDNVSLRVTPEIEPYVIITPNYYGSVLSGSMLKSQIIFTAPAELAIGAYNGTIQVRGMNKGGKQERTFAKPLPVIITVTSPPPLPSERFEIFNDDGSAEAFDFNHLFGRAASFAKFDASGQVPLKIVGVKLYLKPTGQQSSPIDIYVWDLNRNPLMPSPLRFTPSSLDEGWVTVDVSSLNLVVRDEFYLGVAWPVLDAPVLLGVDTTSPQGRSYVVIVSDNVFIPISNSNMMIRAIVEKQ